MKRALLLASFVAVALAITAPATGQKLWNETTFFTFSDPVELPGGMTLPPGKYMFRLADSASNRHIVQVFDERGTTIHGTFLAIEARRLEPEDEPTVEFLETAADQPRAIRTWWYPGDLTGHEFVYPREQALRLAKASTGSVLTTEAGTDVESMRTADLSRVDASGAMTAEARTSTPTTTVDTDRGDTDREMVGTSGRTAARDRAPRRTLPTTASPLELFGLIGLLALVAAASLRAVAILRR